MYCEVEENVPVSRSLCSYYQRIVEVIFTTEERIELLRARKKGKLVTTWLLKPQQHVWRTVQCKDQSLVSSLPLNL